VLAFLVDDTPTVGSTNEQAAFGDLREENIAVTLLGKGLKLRILFIPFLSRSLRALQESVSFILGN
jgi:hypothetical protein